jgi:DNA-binding Lrp family transcriptional regulator
MEELTHPYEEGHLLVAALRLFDHRNGRPPSVRELSEMLGMSSEMGHYLCNRLASLGVLEVVEAAFEERVYLRDHLKLEELPREEKASNLEAEVQKLKEDRERHQEEIQKMQASQESKKKDLFSDLERQLKEGIKKKKNPLDDL